jgi:dUTP pyrophosphatase
MKVRLNLTNKDNLQVKVMYHEGAHKLETHGVWYDLAVPQDVTLKQGEFKIIPFNISMKMPDGYEGYIAPRSSTFKRYGLLQANSFGIIEDTYCGSDDIWGMPVYATRNVEIKNGTRIAQFRIQKIQPKFELVEVKNLDEYANRGGYGSTGESAAE